MIDRDFQARTLELTQRLVRCPSVSRTPGERDVGLLLHALTEEIGGGVLERGLYPVPDDPLGRAVPWALLRGDGPSTVVLLTHFDTVDIGDYGALAHLATEPEQLRAHLRAMPEFGDALAREHLASDDWLWGRGVVDMKSGIAAQLAVLERLCARVAAGERLPGSVLWLSTPDEESESAGILAAIPLLHELRARHGLRYLGAINSDYVSPLFPGDDRRAIYAGTVGKLLPGVYVRGVETHVGEPYNGVDANLLLGAVARRLSSRADLADAAEGEYGVPPVTLKATDLKGAYDVQVPYEAYLLLNVLTLSLPPAWVVDAVGEATEEALREALADLRGQRLLWREQAGEAHEREEDWRPVVVSYGELRARAAARMPEAELAHRLGEVEARHRGAGGDLRGRSVELVRALWDLSGLRGPGAVIFLAPPYYPHARGADDGAPLLEAARAVGDEYGSSLRRYYPYVSDGSYVSRVGAEDVPDLASHMPLWSAEPSPGRYSLPLDAILSLGLDVLNIGVWGYGAHKPEERLHVPYSCGVVPRLILETVTRALASG